LPIGLVAETALAQAPESAGLWRVAAASLSVPPALERNSAGLSWNPAADLHRGRLNAGIELIHTSSTLGMDGIVAGASAYLGARTAIGAVVGRIDVRDLVRTTTTPTAIGGSIPVYTQYAGLSGQVGNDWVRVGAIVRVHDEKFDFVSERGLTFDLGACLHPTDRLILAGATHFLPIDLSRQNTTDYYFGLEYELAPDWAIGSISTAVVGRYGATLRSGESLEHAVGVGVRLAGHIQIDAAIAREVGYETHSLRPGLAIALLLGRYSVGLARSNGLNDLGATYRIGVDASILE